MENTALLLVLFGLGFLGAALSGLLGIGGAIFIIPMLLYVPEWLGLEKITIDRAAGIVVAQVAASMLSGAIAHARRGEFHPRLVIVLSVAMVSAGLVGGIASAYVPPQWLLVLFALLVTLAVLLMLVPPPVEIQAEVPKGFSGPLASVCGVCVGTLIGMLGSGSFMLLPSLIYLLKIPTRLAMGTVLAVGFPAALAALIGKAVTGQVPAVEATAIVLSAIPGAQLGSWASVRLQPRTLRRTYSLVMGLVAIGLWSDVAH